MNETQKKRKGKPLLSALFSVRGDLNRMEYGWVFFLVLTLYTAALFAFGSAGGLDGFALSTSSAILLLTIPVVKRYRAALPIRFLPEALGGALTLFALYLDAVVARLLPSSPVAAQAGLALAAAILLAALFLPPRAAKPEGGSSR